MQVSSCHQGNSVDIRSMNATLQSGAMGHPINVQKMFMCRTGFPVVTVPTAIKSDIRSSHCATAETRNREVVDPSLALISRLSIQCCRKLHYRSQTQLESGDAVAVT